MASGSGYFYTSYRQALAVFDTAFKKQALFALAIAVALFPLVGSNFQVHLVNLCFIAVLGALSQNLLIGYAGQVSLGFAGLFAAGGFTAALMVKELEFSAFIPVVAAASAVGAVLGVLVGLPSLRVKGLYLAVSTLALHAVIVYGASEYQHRLGGSAGIVIPKPSFGPLIIDSDREWYYLLGVVAALTTLACINLVRSRVGRAWQAIRDRDIVAEACGIPLVRYKLLAFTVSSALAAMAGAIDAYHAGFVSVEKYSFLLTVQYLAMIVVGGLGSILGSLLGAFVITLLPFVIDFIVHIFPTPERLVINILQLQRIAFGGVIVAVFLLEPRGLVALWERVKSFFQLWPFKFMVSGLR
ncbi:MAG: branched-chain amino acid ABC transporter permease [Dehalococcoidia bacterium]|nr:branched-chain amino acid ABC transporter permease [Dehalococcoidia bacterium]